MKARDVEPGMAFRYDSAEVEPTEAQFIKLKPSGKFNAVNVASWLPAFVGHDAKVVVLGKVTLERE